jgi:hypothetical protein
VSVMNGSLAASNLPRVLLSDIAKLGALRPAAAGVTTAVSSAGLSLLTARIGTILFSQH